MKKLIIIGAGGLSREVAWLVERINKVLPTWEILGFLDENSDLHGRLVGGYQVLGNLEKISEYGDTYFICSIGSAKIRKKIINKINEGYKDTIKFATLIDPSVIISDSVDISEGVIICAGSILTVDIIIGKHSIINLDCTVGHDCVIENFVTVYPSVNISGNCKISECAELGTGMQIIQGKRIGNESIVGAGSVVIKDIPEKCTAVGSPAKPIKFFD